MSTICYTFFQAIIHSISKSAFYNTKLTKIRNLPSCGKGGGYPITPKACQLYSIPYSKFLYTLFWVVCAQNQPSMAKADENTKSGLCGKRGAAPPPPPSWSVTLAPPLEMIQMVIGTTLTPGPNFITSCKSQLSSSTLLHVCMHVVYCKLVWKLWGMEWKIWCLV